MGDLLKALLEYQNEQHVPGYKGDSELARKGQALREDGYRLIQLPRQIAGFKLNIPPEAIEYDALPAGRIGSYGAIKPYYVIHIYE